VNGAPDIKGPAQVSGTLYLDSFQEKVSYSTTPEQTTYLLSGLYDKFTALAGVRDDANDGDVGFAFQFYNDVTGVQLWSGTVTIGSPLPVEFDVSGVLRLRIKVTRLNGNAAGNYGVLADAKVGGPGISPP
jgi:hypothetical protein